MPISMFFLFPLLGFEKEEGNSVIQEESTECTSVHFSLGVWWMGVVGVAIIGV